MRGDAAATSGYDPSGFGVASPGRSSGAGANT
eukprot:CAMPEP_0202021596 /NCGR_PEP_ID=MMETSP0905-20130828/47345_1 /ASSEMBLY_ACC=CAM_ASM_000554 /TAXON_ID=420261 /ORGANISM="Thalassiosira antarctica, Strain CCMP982" /LENGTH=31 /DNA_ID= /DNA_START= /DNA_END= /DNA_ORIENTATION=